MWRHATHNRTAAALLKAGRLASLLFISWCFSSACTAYAGGAPAPEPEPEETPQTPLLRTDRYTLLRTEARTEQHAPLKTPVHIRFPEQEVRTVGAAMEALVAGSGYRIAYRSRENCLLLNGLLLGRPLPDSLRELGPVSVREGLRALAGKAWQLEVEELGRSLYFLIHPGFYSEDIVAPWLHEPGAAAPGGGLAERAIALIPFGVAEFRTLSARAQEQIAGLAERLQRSGMRILVQGHSHSRAGWATQTQALRRAATVARALEAAGAPAVQIQTEAVHSNHNPQEAQLLHGVRIVALSEDEGEDARSEPLAVVRQSCGDMFPQTTGQTSTEARFFNVEEGSLKRNIERLLQRFDLRIGRWDLRDGRYEYDWKIPHPYEIHADTPDRALEELLDSYGIQPTLNMRDGSVDFSARYSPRRRKK